MDYLLASQVFQSARLCHTYFALNDSPPALYFESACNLRTTQTPMMRKISRNSGTQGGLCCLRSVSVRNFAVSGKSDRMKNEATAHKTVKRPSKIKIHAQPGLPPTPSILAIAAARRPPAGKITSGCRSTHGMLGCY